MDWDAKRNGWALQRIVALLFALADLAERAAVMPFATRAVVLAVLRHAEAVAWAFVLGTLCVPVACKPVDRQPRDAVPGGVSAPGKDDPADAARLACSLRMLALIVAGWAAKVFSSTVVSFPVRCARILTHPGSTGGWRGPDALPAPDTS